ncbi:MULTISPECIES: LysR family transcriptional regulator [Pseudomonadota]|uniref:LysR family transcriptional regulator n=1 Tax=Stutzerimonas stutzeri TaxID=316 RepID=A0A2N8SZ90_STUST|nr:MULTISPECIES: LysR family transcriptional regulator [Pseudomonadota]KWT88536.1 LysR-family transcriptional regulator [Variovorax sp. WDL1]MCQ4249804.1 LysR family transcriptional regulator [Stutzerimonas stutzeri]PNG07810.1 LysR family transcriptional regulator [Stutzerimonas stutzeri]PNG59702.1 HTH-type transcriptional regulator DmlR [Variovorax sp. B4]PNG60507.1 HTH-type transcriptional regulator DmlR [Variovorax sp. B2]
MDSIELIRAFREVATQGSFSAAAKRLGVSKATVSKYVAELETRFDVRLLNRSTRSVSLTDSGELLLARSVPMLEVIERTRAELVERAGTPRGRLRIAAPYVMASGDLPNMLAEFLGFYPEVDISLQMSDEVDLAEDGIDVQLRFGPIENENLIVRRLLRIPMMVCASPPYWKKHGKPHHPDDLREHDALTRSGTHPVWRFEDAGQPIDVPVKSRMEASEGPPLIQVAARGFGVIYVPSLAVQPQVDHGELVPMLQGYGRTDMWLSAAYLERHHNSAAQRALLDYLESRIGQRGRYAGKPLRATTSAVKAAAHAR